jgi:hypothetical protein
MPVIKLFDFMQLSSTQPEADNVSGFLFVKQNRLMSEIEPYKLTL